MKKRDRTTVKKWTMVLVALLDDIAILAVLLLVLWFFKVKFTWPIITVISLLFGGRVYMTYQAVGHSIHQKKVTGSEAMIGLECEVIESLTPTGTVRVGVEYWKAKSVDKHVAAGEDVEIIRVNRLTLEVKLKGQ